MDSENIPANGKPGTISLRLLRPSVVVLCGPAGCGKSTFAEKHFRPTQIISSDWARARISDDERDQRYNSQAFALVHFLVEQRLTVNRLCVVDSTALTAQVRKDLLDLAKKYQVPSTLLVFHVPLETCIERDEKRERSVGKAIVERQFQTFMEGQVSIHEEGFDQVVEFHDGDEGRVQIEILFRPVARTAQRQDPGATRRLDRWGQSLRPRTIGRGNNGHSTPNLLVPSGLTHQSGVVPAPIPRTQSSTVAHPVASQTTADRAGVPSRASIAAKGSPSATAETPDVGAEEGGGS
jgi:predicted kinase